MEFTAADYRWMARALRLARRGLCTSHPNPRVGCVLVVDDECIGEGWHERAGQPHAEVHALTAAGARARGATAYVTLEPCAHSGRTPPCTEALIAAGVVRVVAATLDPYEKVAGRGVAGLRAAGVAVQSGLLEASARELNAGFFSRIERRRPWLRLKLAGSLDAVSALASGESQWITSPEARRDGHRWRARAAAVMTGSGTLLADDPRLNCRVGESEKSIAIVLDSHWRMSAEAAVVGANDQVLWVGGDKSECPDWVRRHATVQAVAVPQSDSGLDLAQVLAALAQCQINEVQVEAGARLSGALLVAGLVDEILLYLAPKLLGAGNIGLARLAGVETLADSINLKIIDCRQTGPDLRLRLRPEPSQP